MPNEVKLNCYTIKVRNRHSRNQRAEYLRLADLAFSDANQVRTLDFKEFFEFFIQSFNGSFQGIVGNDTTVYLPPNSISFASERRLFYGFMKAGKSGIGRSIVDKNHPEDEIFTVTPEHVDAIDYFFLLWIPTNCNVGLLVVQGLSTESASEIYVRLIKKYFADKIGERYIEIDRFVPRDTVQKMEEQGEVKKITLRKQHLPSDRANSILGINFIENEVTLEVKISGLNNVSQQIKSLLDGRLTEALNNAVMGRPRFFTTPVLEEIGMDGTHEVSVEYEFNNKKATAKQSNNFQLAPYYYVDEESIERDPLTNLPTKESIRNYCLDFINIIIQEIAPNYREDE